MEINKLLTLTSSGSKMNLFDLEDKDLKTVQKEDLVFTNLDNLYVAVSPCDLVALDKLGKLHKVNTGDYIIKSNCREIYFTLSPTDTLATLIGKVVEVEAANKARYAKEDRPKDTLTQQDEAVCMNEAISDNLSGNISSR